MNKLIVLNQAPMRSSPGYGDKILDIPINVIVEYLDVREDVPYAGMSTDWFEVKYRDKTGWSYGGYFDEYGNVLRTDVVDLSGLQTPDKYDAKQYIVLDGKKKVNQCGEISCSYIMGKPLSDVLDGWERKEPNIVSRIFKGNSDRGTSSQTLIGLLSSFDYPSVPISEYFKDELLGRPLLTPKRIWDALKSNKIVIGVKIGRDGVIGHSGNINHWVVLDAIDVYGSQAIVDVYNPYNNKMEIYSWDEIISNTAGIDGLVVPFNLIDFEVPEPDVTEIPKQEVEEPLIKDEEQEEVLTVTEKIDVLWEDYISRK